MVRRFAPGSGVRDPGISEQGDAVDRRFDRRVEQLGHEHEQHRVDEQRNLNERRRQRHRDQHQHRCERKLLPERRFVSERAGQSRERVEQRVPDSNQAGLALVRSRPLLRSGHPVVPPSEVARKTGIDCVMEVIISLHVRVMSGP